MRRPAIVAAIILVAIAALAVSWILASGDGPARSATFANSYLPADGGRADLRTVQAATTQGGPIDIGGTVCWPAYECRNQQCPGRGPDGQPFLFAYDHAAKPGRSGPHPQCPRCSARPDLDPSMIAPHLSQEAVAEISRQ
jgi:hypothetical protein